MLRLTLLLLPAVFLAQAVGQLTVSVSFSPAHSVEGAIIRATCLFSTSIAGQSASSVQWRHNSTRSITSGGRYYIDTMTAQGNSELEIDSVVHSDAGEYTCRVQFQSPQDVRTGSATLQVASELVVEAEPEQSAIEGETATLRCNVTSFPEPRITWYSVEAPGTVNEVETELTRQVSTDRNFGVYRIPSADQSDAGLYRCTGRYDFGDETKDITLVVLTVPEITTTATEVVAKYTDSFHLNCTADGIKSPTYRWLQGKVELSDGGRVDLDSENGDLTIRDLSYDDTGNYTCVAETGAGSDNVTHNVTISGPPEISLPESVAELIVAGNTLVEIECPFRSYPLPEVRWFKLAQEGEQEEINSLSERFTISSNGSLFIMGVSQVHAFNYLCLLSNTFGSDNRTFHLRVVELPSKPTEFTITERGDQWVELVWVAPPTSTTRPVDEYVLKLSYEERGTINSTRSIPSSMTSYVAADLVPGVSYSLTLHSSNLAGLSDPTPSLSHDTARGAPRLEFFTVESLGDGRSILLQWRLEYSGGENVNSFYIEVLLEGAVVRVLHPPVFDDDLLLDDLKPSMEYHFIAVVGSPLGVSEPILANATTPIAAPSKPSKPSLHDRSPQSLTLSFSVKFGSAHIEYYLLRIYEAGDPINTTDAFNTTNTSAIDQDLGYELVNISSSDVDYVKREEEIVEGGEVVGYGVRLRVGGLERGTDYVFSVAAGSVIGVGDYSDPSDAYALEDEVVLYLIVGGVAGGVLVVVALLLLALLGIALIKRSHRGGKMAITRRGSDSTGVATDYNLKFEPCNGTTSPRITSPNLSQRVESPRPTSLSPNLHYYNSLRKYQSDTLLLSAEKTESDGVNGVKGKTATMHIHTNIQNGGGVNGVNGKTRDSGIELLDSGHYSRPTSHPNSSQPPPFNPPPSHTSPIISSPIPQSSVPHTPSSTQHNPTYSYPNSRPLHNTPRNGNSQHRAQVSMSALPTTEEVEHVMVLSSGSNTLPHGATMTGYPQMQADQGAVRGERNSMIVDQADRKYHSLLLEKEGLSYSTSTPLINSYDSETVLLSKHTSYQTDV